MKTITVAAMQKLVDDKNVGKQSVRRKTLTFRETKPRDPKTQLTSEPIFKRYQQRMIAHILTNSHCKHCINQQTNTHINRK